METEIATPSETYPGFLYPASQLVNFMYEPVRAVFSLTLDGFNGYATFKPADCYAFRIWLTSHNIREHDPPKYYEQTITIRMQKESIKQQAYTKPEVLPGQRLTGEQPKRSKSEMFFRQLLIVFAFIVGCLFIAVIIYAVFQQKQLPIFH